MVCNFSLDNFIISNTRARSNDTDYVTISVTVGNNAAITKTQAMGDVGNGTHSVGLAVAANIPTDVPTPVVFSCVITNNGNGDHAAVQKGVESTLTLLGKEGAAAVAKEIAQPVRHRCDWRFRLELPSGRPSCRLSEARSEPWPDG